MDPAFTLGYAMAVQKAGQQERGKILEAQALKWPRHQYLSIRVLGNIKMSLFLKILKKLDL